MALNNCVLGNTTICAESPTECEVQSILQHLGVPSGGGGGVGGGGGIVGQSSWRPPGGSGGGVGGGGQSVAIRSSGK